MNVSASPGLLLEEADSLVDGVWGFMRQVEGDRKESELMNHESRLEREINTNPWELVYWKELGIHHSHG